MKLAIAILVLASCWGYAQDDAARYPGKTTTTAIQMSGPDVWDQNDVLLIHCAGWKSKCTLAKGRTLDDVAAYLLWREKARADAGKYLVNVMDECEAFATKLAKGGKK
jgi:hypothetical protein